MKTTLSNTATRLSRISSAGILIAFSGMAVAFADAAPRANDSASASAGSRSSAGVGGPGVKSAVNSGAEKPSGDAKSDQSVTRESIDRDLRAGKYTRVAEMLRKTQPQLRELPDVDLYRIVAQRARELLLSEQDAERPGDFNGSAGSNGPLVFDGPTSSGRSPYDNIGTTEWENPPNAPGMGSGWRVSDTYTLQRERQLRLLHLAYRSIYGNTVTPPNPAFADAQQDAGGGGIWPPLALPSNTRDFDGDGELFDPLPARPIVIYYQFLEENMTDIEWIDGEDNINQIGLRTDDTNEDEETNFADEADETDDIADTWGTNDPAIAPFIDVSVIPPPVADDFDEDLAPFLAASGLGTIKWGDARPAFLHPDAEAAWRLAQSLYPLEFEETWDSGQVLEEEERLLVLEAMRIIESVTNIIFLERPDWAGFTPQNAPPLQGFGPGISYPLNAVGYPLEVNAPTIAVDPGGIVSGDPALPATTEVPWYPEDDYPWMLIMKGSNPADGENGPSGVTELGTTRNATGLPSIDFVFTDLDGDGFPDTPDSNADGFPDQIIYSTLGVGNIIPMDAAGRSVLDADGSTAIDAADAALNGLGVIPFPAAKFRNDYNFDGGPDTVIDTNGDGDAAVIDLGFPILPYPQTGYGDLALDLDGDNAADSVYPSGTNPSPFHILFDNIPCSRFGLNQQIFETEDIGFIVAQLVGGPLSMLPEHNRPDREDFIRVLEENNDSNLGGLDIIPGGSDKYANFIENFDTTTATDPTATPHDPLEWTLDNSGATAGGWAFLDPTVNVDDGAAPPIDYAVDDEDMSAIALVTGAVADTQIQGTSIFTSPNIYGPEDASVRFAYWINSESGAAIQEDDGLIVQTSSDGGSTWTDLITLTEQDDEWQLAEVVIGETRADDQTGLPTFRVRFIARNTDPSRAIEMAIDRIRVQNPYDFLSITHGGEFFNARTTDLGFETIQVREDFSEFEGRIGQATGLSQGDRIGLTNLYGIPILPDGDEPAPDPCRADVNGDGTISSVDVALFLELFNAGDPRADFADPEGVIDIFDIVAFFNDVQNSFRCLNDPDNNFGLNNLTPLNPPG